jgi:hypothetical protein
VKTTMCVHHAGGSKGAHLSAALRGAAAAALEALPPACPRRAEAQIACTAVEGVNFSLTQGCQQTLHVHHPPPQPPLTSMVGQRIVRSKRPPGTPAISGGTRGHF